VASSTNLFSPGDIVGGAYRIEGRLGEGGMAVVYRATQTGTRRQCALKFIRPRMLTDQRAVQQFVLEARAAGRIGVHPNVVAVFETGVAEQHGIPFIAMELCEGQTLSAYCTANGALPWPDADSLIEQIGEGLDAAHAAGLVHRDLNPNNAMVNKDHKGRLRLKVLDFGIVKFLEASTIRTATTVGTAQYQAPEQLGARVREAAAASGFTIARGVSPQTDVFALGLLAFELFTGLTAESYWGPSPLDHVQKSALKPREPASERAGARASGLPHGFDAWFARTTAHNAADRWPSAGEAASRLSWLLTQGA
jgi:serine/threonine-protein kinase